MVAQLLQVAMGVVDTIMLGRYGTLDLAAAALGSSLLFFITLVNVGLLMGSASIIAHLNGGRCNYEIAEIFQQTLWLALGLGVVSLITMREASSVLIWAGVEQQIIPLTDAYLDVIAWSMPASILYLAGRFVSEGLEYARPMMIIQLLTLPINILGNYLLIFGHWGFPEMGIRGAALATAIAVVIACFLIILNCKFNAKYYRYELFVNFSRPNLATFKKILILGMPIAISISLESGLFATVAMLMGRLGTLTAAAHQIAINYATLMLVIPLSLSMAATVRVGNAAGAGRKHEVVLRAWTAISLSAMFMSGTALISLFCHQFIAALYTNDMAVTMLAGELLILAGIFQIPDGLQMSTAGVLRGLKDTFVPMLLSLLGYWIIGFSVAYILAIKYDYGPHGLWIGLIIGLSAAAVFFIRRFKHLIKI